MAKKVLFLVASPFQLFNAIILRMTVRRECDCDMLLRSAISWNEEVIQRLKDKKIFGEIYRPDFTEAEKMFWEVSMEERATIVENPMQFYGEPPVPLFYDEMFAALDAAAWKLVYYYQVLNGKKPDIIQYDEGVRSYSIEFHMSDDRTFYEGPYANNSYSKAIKAIYLYRPELYAVKKYDYEIYKIPNPYSNEDVRMMLLEVFGQEPMPKERYIYFEDFFFTDRHPTNDLLLFEEIASMVGKDNIIVKTHPRDDYNRFLPLGYKTIGHSKVPWEVQLLANDANVKVLISVTSTAILTPFTIFDRNTHIISLEKMFKWPVPLHNDSGFYDYLKKLLNKMNEKEVHFHMPSSMEELKEVLLYTSGLYS